VTKNLRAFIEALNFWSRSEQLEGYNLPAVYSFFKVLAAHSRGLPSLPSRQPRLSAETDKNATAQNPIKDLAQLHFCYSIFTAAYIF
jgi:hypothetical protein